MHRRKTMWGSKLMKETKNEYTFNAPVASIGNQGQQINVAGEVKGN